MPHRCIVIDMVNAAEVHYRHDGKPNDVKNAIPDFVGQSIDIVFKFHEEGHALKHEMRGNEYHDPSFSRCLHVISVNDLSSSHFSNQMSEPSATLFC